MSSIDETFQQLRAAGRKAFIPFITAGDPDLAMTAALIATLAKNGASLIEIGVPYSDPVADGPIIQASYTRALNSGVKLSAILNTTRAAAAKIKTPLISMISYAIVLRHGLEKYVADAQESGLSGAIVPDLPLEESAALADICQKADFSLIQLVTPTTPRERAVKIAENSTGFLYYVSIAGITGERAALPERLLEEVSWLREQTPLPVCIGFGISQSEHVRLLAPVADGLIVGSAIVRRAAEAQNRPREEVLREVGAFTAELVSALG